MSDLLAEGYIEEQSAQRKAVESAPSINMVCNILNFLDAWPMTLFEGPPVDRAERDLFYEENLEALISCIVTSDESVRRSATAVAKRLFANEQLLATLRSSRGLSAKAFKTRLWRLTYVPFLIKALELIGRGADQSAGRSSCYRFATRLDCRAPLTRSGLLMGTSSRGYSS